MKVLVDFLPLLPRGGGLQNARNLWRAVDRLGGDHEWLALARPELGLEPDAGPHHRVLTVPATSLAGRMWAETVDVPRRVRSWGADVVWTPMGAGPLRAPAPRVMGWHDSSIAYPESPVHARLNARERATDALRGVMARTAARGAAVITVQTEVMRERLARLWSVPEHRFHVVPNGPSAFLVGEAPAPVVPPDPPVVLVLAEAKPAKNLEIVPYVAAELARRGRTEVRIVLTVGPAGEPYARLLDEAAVAAGPGLPLERIGRVPHEALGDLYRRAAVVFLPSHFESFSATYLEAMHFGVPLVTSDADFARALCGDAALYADPASAGSCADALERALDDGAERARLRAAGARRLGSFPDWDERFALYVAALESAVGGTVRASRPAGVDA